MCSIFQSNLVQSVLAFACVRHCSEWKCVDHRGAKFYSALGAAAQLLPETLYLTTNLIDRFLELKGVLTEESAAGAHRPPDQALNHSMLPLLQSLHGAFCIRGFAAAVLCAVDIFTRQKQRPALSSAAMCQIGPFKPRPLPA